ncbi:MAG: hypothetical protein J0I88_03195 [Chryseobacterium sp.]|uniref:Uncharacterized protein n=1 Tax=Epilithonimonas pallida TaxID=373671 RepID=A0ABY1R2S9_9FLAO|nr:hypothetical protein [Epilithonimonas pallida]MBN9336839.1 hypothetical protein [Chryseobacterium sp.]OJX32131.1 MAG: hypothetical protein BGO86_08120 [Chryseobacterium sp. 36-9]SMP91659.1 hypothetical protein SAMN05421679_103199 [Epilithonimonas pallida]
MSETKVKPNISEDLLLKLKTEILEEKQVILHCCYKSDMFLEEKIRIWSSTYLVDRHSEHISKLIHFENISLFPDWTDVPYGKEYWFTLIFSGLPKDCLVFDFIELIPQNGGFFQEGIVRNSSDVYKIKLDI